MGELLLGVLEQLLKFGNLTLEEKHRYEDDVKKLKEAWYEEYAKLETDMGSDSALDDIELKLRLTGEAILETYRSKHS
jgi:hypothetical protein